VEIEQLRDELQVGRLELAKCRRALAAIVAYREPMAMASKCSDMYALFGVADAMCEIARAALEEK
jgi:hypothetical protein